MRNVGCFLSSAASCTLNFLFLQRTDVLTLDVTRTSVAMTISSSTSACTKVSCLSRKNSWVMVASYGESHQNRDEQIFFSFSFFIALPLFNMSHGICLPLIFMTSSTTGYIVAVLSWTQSCCNFFMILPFPTFSLLGIRLAHPRKHMSRFRYVLTQLLHKDWR